MAHMDDAPLGVNIDDLVGQLLVLAEGDLGLVEKALKNAAADRGRAPRLGEVVQYIITAVLKRDSEAVADGSPHA